MNGQEFYWSFCIQETQAKFKYPEKTLPTSPNGKKSLITLVQLLHVKEGNVWIVQLKKSSGFADFMKPLHVLVNGNPARALDDFHIIAEIKH